MFRVLRTLHRWAGLVGALFLILIALTGFILALKDVISGVKPPTAKGSEVAGLHEVVPVSVALDAAFAQGIPELKGPDDVDRFEYHAGKNVFKVLSAEGYHEVQVDGKTGEVVSVGLRNDQRFEDIHDLRAFHPSLRELVLPVVAVILFVLGVSGVVMFFVPVVRRAKFRREQKRSALGR